MMYLYAEVRFTLKEDFNTVKTELVWLAEIWLPVGTAYTIWYDPDVLRVYGRGVKVMRLQVERSLGALPALLPKERDPIRVQDCDPPLWDAVVGLYRVRTWIAEGEPPALPDNWRTKRQLRHNAAQELQSLLAQARGEQDDDPTDTP